MKQPDDDASSLPAARIPLGEDGHPLTRLQIKEACRLAYISGRARLTELCTRYAIPYDTLRTWSREEGWGSKQVEVQAQAHSQIVPSIADWVATERVKQVKRALLRSGKVQGKLDELMDTESIILNAKDLQSIAMAEEKCDLIARRNLGMDDGGGSGSATVNVNVLGSVQIQ